MTHHPSDDPQGSCPNCEIEPFIRNNYFRGKFLDVFDFTTEQRYFIDKLRLHHQRLHGWGVVCGLRVKAHSSPNCQSKYICIEPGSAIDCCGHEILLLEEECIDFTQLPAIKALIDKKDTDFHRLQICLRYRECPTEPVPVLYDDCGCDENRCLPNRILESFEIDVILNAEDQPAKLYTPKFKWDFSLNFAHAYQVVLHDAGDSPRLYVLTEDNTPFANVNVYQIDMDNHSTISAHNLAAKGLALAVSNDGTRLYVVTESAVAGDPKQLAVLDTTHSGGLKAINTSPIPIPKSAGSDIALAVTADNHLLSLITQTGDLFSWPTDIDTNAAPTPPTTPIATLGAVLNVLALSSDGKFAYTANTSNTLIQLPMTGAAITKNSPSLPATAQISALTVINRAGIDVVYATDQTGKQVFFWSTDDITTALTAMPTDYPPVAFKASADGRWLFVVEQDMTSTPAASYIQAISTQGQKPAGAPYPIGHPAQGLALTHSGDRLYIPYPGDLGQAGLGGVAVVEVSEQNCCEIPWRQLEGCANCEQSNCLVLATIENFQIGDSIQDQTNPPADTEKDKTAKTTRIDNRKGRRLLPTPQVLLELIECLKQQGAGKPGPAGPQGLQGPKGDSVTGPAGPGLETGLTRIEALSWTHNDLNIVTSTSPDAPASFHVPITLLDGKTIVRGIVIGFTDIVDTKTIDADHVFQVLVNSTNKTDISRGLKCRCPIAAKTIPVDLDTKDGRIILNALNRIDKATESKDGAARGVAFILDRQLAPIAREIIDGFIDNLWIILRGDFVKDSKNRAIDAEFVRAELPTGDRPSPPAGQPLDQQLGIQGGTFESWLTISNQG